MGTIKHMVEPAVGAVISSGEQHKNVLLVEWALQVGKTTLVEHASAATGKRVSTANLEASV